MNKQAKILNKIAQNKDLSKRIANQMHYSPEQFVSDANRYIKATKEGRMLAAINSVSHSGMSRTMLFSSLEKGKNDRRYFLKHYFNLFSVAGYTRVKDAFRIHGCGMDMVFHTNYEIINMLASVGLITKKQAEGLRQQTPSVL